MGITRIVSPSSQERSEDKNQERRDEMEIYASVFFGGGNISAWVCLGESSP
jgi:hypothetical protein